MLELRGISKTFPGVKALDGVDFTLRTGEIHALMGENGAGKSTLIKILTGVYSCDEGSMVLDGRPLNPDSPRTAEHAGISTVYQEVNLVPDLSVAENIMLGREPTGPLGGIRWRAIRERAEKALDRLGLSIDVQRNVSTFSIAIKQMVAVARALDLDARLLILDEPTSSLDDDEVDQLFTVLRQLQRGGLSIIFITHFLDQVYKISDRITVLRNGRQVGEYATPDLPRLELIAAMMGREVQEIEHLGGTITMADRGREQAEPFLKVRGLGAPGRVEDIDMEVNRGEVVGLAGLLGSGRTETARLIFGVERAASGTIEVEGEHVRIRSPRDAIRRGIAFCSEDRKVEGIIPTLSVRENLILALQGSRGPMRRLPREEQETLATHYIQALGIKTPTPETPIENLSGGNQQKVLVARWLCMSPQLTILDEPTRGIDVGAKAEIEKLVAGLREEGTSVLFISSELEEVVRSCERVLVLCDRRKAGELSGEEISEQNIMRTIAEYHEDTAR